jgi:hypothetical protein
MRSGPVRICKCSTNILGRAGLSGLEKLGEDHPEFAEVPNLVLRSLSLRDGQAFFYEVCNVPPILLGFGAVQIRIICTSCQSPSRKS